MEATFETSHQTFESAFTPLSITAVDPETTELVSISKIRAYHEAFLNIVKITDNGDVPVPFNNLGLEENLMVQNVLNNIRDKTDILFVGESHQGVRLSISWDPRDTGRLLVKNALIRAQAPVDPLGQAYIPE